MDLPRGILCNFLSFDTLMHYTCLGIGYRARVRVMGSLQTQFVSCDAHSSFLKPLIPSLLVLFPAQQLRKSFYITARVSLCKAAERYLRDMAILITKRRQTIQTVWHSHDDRLSVLIFPVQIIKCLSQISFDTAPFEKPIHLFYNV